MRVRRSEEGMLLGVCDGLAQSLDLDPNWLRLSFALLALAGGIGVILYIALALLLPGEGGSGPMVENLRENLDELLARIQVQRRTLGLLLIVAGTLWLFARLGLLDWLSFGTAIPLAIIALGGALMFRKID